MHEGDPFRHVNILFCIKKGIYETTYYLEQFLRNLLLDEENELHNREMHVSGKFKGLQKCDPKDDPKDDPKVLAVLPNEREREILDLLTSESTITRAQMAERLGCSDATIKRTLQNLIRRIGSKRNGEWIIM